MGLARKPEVLQTCKREDRAPVLVIFSELDNSGESEQSCNERDLPRDVAL